MFNDNPFQNSCKITNQIDYKSIDIHNFCLVDFQMNAQIEEGFYLKIFVWYNKLKRTDEAKEISPNGTCDEMSFFTKRKDGKQIRFISCFEALLLGIKRKLDEVRQKWMITPHTYRNSLIALCCNSNIANLHVYYISLLNYRLCCNFSIPKY